MTDKSVVQSWSREQLESAFTQREGQLETMMQENVALRAEIKTGNGLYYELQRERDQLKQQLAQAREDLAKLNTHWTAKGWLSPDEAKPLRDELARWQNAFAMFKGTPEELAQWSARDAADLQKMRDEANRLEAEIDLANNFRKLSE